ncbi:MAG: hypothetical protein AB1649_18305, partial [Chloroflexota bacterium]
MERRHLHLVQVSAPIFSFTLRGQRESAFVSVQIKFGVNHVSEGKADLVPQVFTQACLLFLAIISKSRNELGGPENRGAERAY